eukprot:5571256-Amphidinium_carterae.1
MATPRTEPRCSGIRWGKATWHSLNRTQTMMPSQKLFLALRHVRTSSIGSPLMCALAAVAAHQLPVQYFCSSKPIFRTPKNTPKIYNQ